MADCYLYAGVLFQVNSVSKRRRLPRSVFRRWFENWTSQAVMQSGITLSLFCETFVSGNVQFVSGKGQLCVRSVSSLYQVSFIFV